MKLKYYLRGLGIGIAVTALVLSVSGKQSTGEMTDEQVKARAAELGMVEEGLLSDVLEDSAEAQSQTDEEDSTEETTSEEMTTEEVTTEENVTEETTTEEVTLEETESEALTSEETATKIAASEEVLSEENIENKIPAASESEQIEIVVNSGESSVSISKKLAIAGLIDNAAKYDAYLCKNGYDKKICTGTHIIEKGATEEEIAQIITKTP